MAVSLPTALPIPPPSEDEAEALAIAGTYFTRVGTQVASRLLGCPTLDGEVVMLADLSDNLLGSAALCVSLIELADLN